MGDTKPLAGLLTVLAPALLADVLIPLEMYPRASSWAGVVVATVLLAAAVAVTVFMARKAREVFWD